ncbi:MAG TPA: VOC family protein [Chitinophagaceae bacterium]|jgi:PhnB protein
MATANFYLNFNGTAEEAFAFYKSVLGGEFTSVLRFRDTAEAPKLPPGDQDKLMHISMPIGKGNVLMGTDALESAGHKLTVGNNFHISLSPESEEEANKLYNGLSAGGKAKMPLTKTFWGALFGMFTDRFGVQWMINYEYPTNK